MSFLIGIEM